MPNQLAEALETATLSRREVMEKAFDSLSTEEGSDDAGEVESGAPASAEIVESAGKSLDSIVELPGKEKSEPVKSKDGKTLPGKKTVTFQAKDAKGVQKPGVVQQPIVDEKAAAVVPDEKAVVKAKPPGGWTPEEREGWDKLPEGAQKAILRRESDFSRALNDSAAARRWATDFHKIVSPHEHLMRASGVTPLQAVNNLVNTAALLQVGTPAQKAGTIANIIRTYGIDITMLDSLLAGKAPPEKAAQSDALMAAIDQRLKPVQDFMQKLDTSKTAAERRLEVDSSKMIDDFKADPKNEFYEDLSADIADLLDLATNRGREMTLRQAYDLAASQHPEISKVIEQRKAAERTQAAAKNLQKSRRAASSQAAGTPGGLGTVGAKPAGRRSAIDQAWDDLSAG